MTTKDDHKWPGEIIATEGAPRALDLLIHNHIVQVAKRRRSTLKAGHPVPKIEAIYDRPY